MPTWETMRAFAIHVCVCCLAMANCATARAQTAAESPAPASGTLQLELLTKKDRRAKREDRCALAADLENRAAIEQRPGVMIGEATPIPDASAVLRRLIRRIANAQQPHRGARRNAHLNRQDAQSERGSDCKNLIILRMTGNCRSGRSFKFPPQCCDGVPFYQSHAVSVDQRRLMETPSSQQWFLRKHGDGTIFGPLSFEQLSAWAASAQIAPHDALSTDQEMWMKAPMLPELCMDWLVEVTRERYYGPTTLGAVQEFLRLGEINGETFIINSCDGTRRQISEIPGLLSKIEPVEEAIPAPSPNTFHCWSPLRREWRLVCRIGFATLNKACARNAAPWPKRSSVAPSWSANVRNLTGSEPLKFPVRSFPLAIKPPPQSAHRRPAFPTSSARKAARIFRRGASNSSCVPRSMILP